MTLLESSISHLAGAQNGATVLHRDASQPRCVWSREFGVEANHAMRQLGVWPDCDKKSERIRALVMHELCVQAG